MPKVTLITMEYPPYYGGVGAYYYNLIKASDTEINVLADTSNLNNKQPLPGIGYISLFNKNGLFKWLKIVSIIKQIKLTTQQPLIWAGNLLPIGSACLIAKKLYKVDYFVSLHGLDWQCANKNFRKKWLAKLILKHALFITTNSQATTNLLPVKYKGKVSVIYPDASIKTADNSDDVLNKNGLLNNKYFLSVGRLVQRKGQKQSIEAWQWVSKNFPDYKLAIVGNGPIYAELSDLIEQYNLKDKVVIIKNATDDDLGSLYSNAFCFLFPVQPLKNDSEGFGIVCLEAQNYNLPVITTKTGGIVEAVNNSALLLNSATSQEIYEAVKRVIIDENYRQTLVAGSPINAQLFSWSKSAKILNDLIKKYE